MESRTAEGAGQTTRLSLCQRSRGAAMTGDPRTRRPKEFSALVQRFRDAVWAVPGPDAYRLFVMFLSERINQDRWVATGILDIGGQAGGGGISLEYIADEMKLKERTLKRAVKWAQRMGFITVLRRRDPVSGHN